MRYYFLLLIVFAFFHSPVFAQIPPTFLKTFDPNPQNEYISDKGTNVWSIGDNIYVVNGYVNEQGGRTQQIIEIDADDKTIIKKVVLEGPQGDIYVSEIGGNCITHDQYILLTGGWYDYIANIDRTFLAKLDRELNIIWINYFTTFSTFGMYGDGIVELLSGDYFFSATELMHNTPNAPAEISTRVIKVDTAGNMIFSKILPDTFHVARGGGSLVPTDDGNLLLSTTLEDYYTHPFEPYNNLIYKLDENANVLWSKVLKFNPFYNIQSCICTSLEGGGCAAMWIKDTFSPDPNLSWTFNIMYGLDSNGHQIWTHEWNLRGNRIIYNIKPAANGDILGVGYFLPPLGIQVGWTQLFRLNPLSGETIWEYNYSDTLLRPWSPRFEMLDLCELDDGRIAATGIALDTTLNPPGYLNPNVALLVVDANGCLEEGCNGYFQYITGASEPLEPLQNLPSLEVRPNPVAGFFTVNLPTTNAWRYPFVLRFFDMQGKVVHTQTSNSASLQVDASAWPQGAYRAVVYAKGRAIASGQVVVHR